MSMLSVSLNVNGRPVTATVEPRTQLCELLREELNLTGTHLGCEQGVCGACTVVVDGKPQRSCISYAGDSDGCSVITIEGFDDDALMEQLRDAFSRHHALQCGFCTPGMLVTARDVILRLGETDAARIREELSGNLCRCTGYVGIVEAIEEVSRGRVARNPQAPVVATEGTVAVRPVDALTRPSVPVNRPAAPAAPAGMGPRKGWSSVEQRLTVDFPPEIVWNRLSDIRQVSLCLPGAEITELQDDRVRGRMNVSLGPMKIALNGDGNLALDGGNRIGRLSGRGQDAGSGSAAEGEVEWRVVPGEASGCLILVNLSWRLSGRLAQFNRAGIVQDVIQRLASIFVSNLESSLNGEAINEQSIKPLSIWSLMLGVFRSRIARWRGKSI
jgi:aerobic-type carbon monoxide dehydrogenase small subunit (CoxS/CutS family)/carbon monoxide dehydrogenase subunit G